MNRAIFIASLSHSGSTVLDLLLSGHPNLCGLGETYMLLEPQSRRRFLDAAERHVCSCGEPIDCCPLWDPVLADLEAGRVKGLCAAYARLLEQVRRECGSDSMIVDSSKHLGALKALRPVWQELGIEAVVLHLVRDARGFTTSLAVRDRERGPRRWIRSFKRLGAWHRQNLQIEQWLATSELPCVAVSYEQLCAQPETTLRGLCQQLGLVFSAALLDPSRSAGHVGVGNPMRSDPVRSQRLVYDARWRSDLVTRLLYRLRRRVRAYNKARVYPLEGGC